MDMYYVLWAIVQYRFCAQLFPWWQWKLFHWFLCPRQGPLENAFSQWLWFPRFLHVNFQSFFSPLRLPFSPLTPGKQLTIELVTMFFSGHSFIWGKRNDWLHAIRSPHAYSFLRGLFILSALLCPGDQNAWPQWPWLLWCLVVWSLETGTLK